MLAIRRTPSKKVLQVVRKTYRVWYDINMNPHEAIPFPAVVIAALLLWIAYFVLVKWANR